MSRTDPQFNLRIPESLRDLVMAAAKENKRSATAEILARLEQSFTEPDGLGISDRARLEENGEPASERKITTGVSKQKLMDAMDPYPADVEGTSYAAPNAVISQAIQRAMEALGELDQLVGRSASPKGPKPRKRYLRSK